MLDIAQSLAASTSVHALAGSSRPGAVPPLVQLGATVAHQPACGHASAATCGHMDAEVIDLAERVVRLNQRENLLVLRVVQIEDAVFKAMPPRPRIAEGLLDMEFKRSVEADGTRVMVIREPTGWAAEQEALDEAHKAALADHEEREEAEEARRGLPWWNKLRDRAIERLERWGLQLAEMEPITQAGLAAKAAAAAAVAEGNELPDEWRQKLAISLSRDAARLAAAPCEPGGDAELFDLLARRADAVRVEQEASAAFDTAMVTYGPV